MFNKVILLTILLLAGAHARYLDTPFEKELFETVELDEEYFIEDSKENVNLFTQGFLEGIGTAKVFDEIRACLKDSEEVQRDIMRGIQLIKTKVPANVKEGIKYIGKAVQIIPIAANECRSASADIQKIIALIKEFTNPKSFIYNVGKSLLINHVEVIAEVKHIIESYDSKNYHDIGFWVGKTMVTIFLGEKNVLSQEMVDYINSQDLGWKAEIPEQFEGKTLEALSENLIPIEMMNNMKFDDITIMDYEGLQNDLPEKFDARQQWPGCVHGIRDQGHCGSCWAFAASESLSDRFCIESNKKIDNVLSPQYLVSCNNILNHGCNGGNPLLSWKFLERTGVVTDKCLPYQSGTGENPVKCHDFKTCVDGSPLVHYFAKSGSTVLLPNPTSIQTNLLKYGPLEAAFMVYEDFKAYKSGIYKHASGKLLGGHAVKIVGWGKEGNDNYWIVANSWTEKWGENGFFRIAFGQCGIDSQCVVGQADLNRIKETKEEFFF